MMKQFTTASEQIRSAVAGVVQSTSNIITTVIPPPNRKENGILVFYPNVESNKKDKCILYHNTLLEQFDKITGTEPEKILKIAVYKTPLIPVASSIEILYHAYLVLQTETWYYSLETKTQQITLQRSKCPEDVRDMYEGASRGTVTDNTAPSLIVEAKGEGTIRDVMEYLYKKQRLNVDFNWFWENCKDMAKWIFDEFNSEGRTLKLTFTKYGKSDN
ncbi:hypothetical protein I4U23_011264 [Adineta vaga]|nr:hypothetical protein I4U23_011264 [Adineta vaga]